MSGLDEEPQDVEPAEGEPQVLDGGVLLCPVTDRLRLPADELCHRHIQDPGQLDDPLQPLNGPLAAFDLGQPVL